MAATMTQHPYSLSFDATISRTDSCALQAAASQALESQEVGFHPRGAMLLVVVFVLPIR